MIRQIGMKDSIPQTITQALEIFKKCMLIDEELFNKVSRANSQASVIKLYLSNLGQFIGGLTVAANRPIFTRELDLKQLLIEGF